MNKILPIITHFSEKESTTFIQFLTSKNRRGDSKNIRLYKELRKGNTTQLDHFLYGKNKKNAFNALVKRLQDNLVEFIANQGFEHETSEEMQVLKWLLASRILLEQGQLKLGFKILERAEKLATEHDLFGVLNEIYNTQIQHAHLQSKWDLTNRLELSQKNFGLLQKEQQLNAAYALLKNRLKKQDYSSINELTEEALYTFNIKTADAFTYKSIYQFMELLSTTAAINRNFYHFSPILLEAFKKVKKKSKNQEKHIYYHLHILHTIAITYFRNKEFEKSLQILSEMEATLRLQKRKWNERFESKIRLIKALNYQYNNRSQEALELLDKNATSNLDVLLTKVMMYFQRQQFKKGYQLLRTCNKSNAWYEKQMGLIWGVKKNIIEILLLIELDKPDLVWIHLERFKKYIRPKSDQLQQNQILPFIQLVSYYYEHPKKATSVAFKETVEDTLIFKEPEAEDIFAMSFYAWLKSKMEVKPLYETTLELVSQ